MKEEIVCRELLIMQFLFLSILFHSVANHEIKDLVNIKNFLKHQIFNILNSIKILTIFQQNKFIFNAKLMIIDTQNKLIN